MNYEILFNIAAMVLSFIAMIFLISVSIAARGGGFSKSLNFIIIGITLAVFVHAGFELVASFGLLNDEILLLIMGTLISLGAVFLIVGGYLLRKEFMNFKK